MDLATGYRGHIGRWRRAVQLQDERIRAHPWRLGVTDRWVDTELFALSVRNLLQACWACHACFDQDGHAPFQQVVEDFEAAVPHARVIRDLLQHFDRYEQEGNLDFFISSDEPPAWSMGPEGYSLHVQELRLDLATAVKESDRLASAALNAIDYLVLMLEITGELPAWPPGSPEAPDPPPPPH